jgi:uncharacterized protein
MADSLRDQLLKSGLVQKLKVETKPAPPARPAVARTEDKRPGAWPGQGRPQPQRPQGNQVRAPQQAATKPAVPKPPGGEPDLAQAYALRARSEREERERAQREAEQKAREKRERKEQVARLLQGKALNAAEAEHARHFEHGGKIRRVYCTQDQLAALNRGELAVVQQGGRYLLVSAELAQQLKAIAAEALVLLVDPNAPLEDDVPADLIW